VVVWPPASPRASWVPTTSAGNGVGPAWARTHFWAPLAAKLAQLVRTAPAGNPCLLTHAAAPAATLDLLAQAPVAKLAPQARMAPAATLGLLAHVAPAATLGLLARAAPAATLGLLAHAAPAATLGLPAHDAPAATLGLLGHAVQEFDPSFLGTFSNTNRIKRVMAAKVRQRLRTAGYVAVMSAICVLRLAARAFSR
jgi:antitoxin (DNA-binding transcriptional repressor) of toxin-antitoxin stability system